MDDTDITYSITSLFIVIENSKPSFRTFLFGFGSVHQSQCSKKSRENFSKETLFRDMFLALNNNNIPLVTNDKDLGGIEMLNKTGLGRFVIENLPSMHHFSNLIRTSCSN